MKNGDQKNCCEKITISLPRLAEEKKKDGLNWMELDWTELDSGRKWNLQLVVCDCRSQVDVRRWVENQNKSTEGQH